MSIKNKTNSKTNIISKQKVSDDTFFDLSLSKTFVNMDYNQQLKVKKDKVQSLFKGNHIEYVVESPSPLGYRHKVVLSATNVKTQNNNFQIKLGLYKEGTKNIIPDLTNKMHDPEINEIFKTVEQTLQKYKITAYHFKNLRGIIKHVLIRKSFHYGDVMIVFVTQGNVFPNNKKIIQDIVSKHNNVKTVIQNIHNRETPIVILDNEVVLYGPGYIKDKIDDFDFRLSAQAFYQVNPAQMINMYNYALKIANLNSNMTVLDAYSGIGTISLLASKYVKEVIAVEINSKAHKDAIYNKNYNKVNNVTFYNDDVINFIKTFNQPINLLIMDPTRDGASVEFLEAVNKLKPEKIVYISCNPMTQARDINILNKQYRIQSIQPFDMFPYSAHVENIVLLELKTY